MTKPLNIKTISQFLLCSMTFLMASLSAEATKVGEVISVKGHPFILRQLKKVSIKKGAPVYRGDIVRSGSKEHVTLQLSNGHKVFVLPSSSTTLKDISDNNTDLTQDQGSLWFKVRPLKEKESFQLRTPTAVAGVRGTAFMSMLVGDATDVCVCEGEVEVASNKTNEKTVLASGFGSQVAPKQAPSPSFVNRSFIFQKRRLSRKAACYSCHWAGVGDTSRFDEESNLIFRAPIRSK